MEIGHFVPFSWANNILADRQTDETTDNNYTINNTSEQQTQMNLSLSLVYLYGLTAPTIFFHRNHTNCSLQWSAVCKFGFNGWHGFEELPLSGLWTVVNMWRSFNSWTDPMRIYAMTIFFSSVKIIYQNLL